MHPVRALFLSTALLGAAFLLFRPQPPAPPTASSFQDTVSTNSGASPAPIPADSPLPSQHPGGPNPSPAPATAAAPDPAPPPAPTPDAVAVAPDPDPVREPDFAAFLDWARTTSPASDPHPIGLDLAQRRRDDLADLIRSNPKRALELALPDSIRARLPEAVAALVEARVSARGDLEVLCVLPDPAATTPPPPNPIQRYAVFGERRFEAFVHGQRVHDPTLRDIPLQGITLDDLMAVDELPPLLPAAAVGGTDATGATDATVSAGRPALQSDATEGTKRLLFIRVDFSDLVGEPFTTNRTAQLVRELHAFYQDNSYGRSGFFQIGAGSAVTPVFRLSRTASSYGSANAFATLRSDARNAARAAGYNLADFDYDLICMGSVPGFNWGGLGFIGAPGAWIRGNSSTGVVAHELGHNYGLQHANFWDTGGQSTLGAGSSIEYGDKFDTMGAANAGNYHFNARYKRLLGWLKEGEYTVATTNGSYRIHAHDQTNGVALARGLQVFANARTNYWLEFRQRFTANPWLLSGAGLRWNGRGSEPSLLLDTTPGSSREKDDAAITLGRTFSDRVAGIHLTPVAKGGSNPAWLDVVVQRGAFPDNVPPTLALSASATSGSTSSTLEFRASAADPDNTTLAYHWDFGDDTLGPNAPTVSHRWSDSGEYTVLCTVSDMRGGTARRAIAVRIGSPSSLRVTGRVRRDGQPVQGARVAAGAGRQTFTDSEGAYLLTGLPRGTLTLTALIDGERLTPAGFSNPLNLTGNLDGLDFTALDPAGPRPITLLPAGSSWRFWDKGSLPDPEWSAPGFDDSTWDSGAAILGYGGDKETTVIGFGPNPGGKHITTWFRQGFLVEDPGRLSNVRLGLLRDDGAVVHLNGAELLRDNMPTGTLTPETPARSAVGGTAELTYFEFDIARSRLVPGTNIFAVEIRQSSGSSSDLAFDLRLTADTTPVPGPGVQLTRPDPDQVFSTPARIPISALPGNLGTASLRHIVFLADDQEIGTATQPPYSILWNTPAPGHPVLVARAIQTDGTFTDSPGLRIEVRDAQLTPIPVPRGSTWRYLDTGIAPPATWTTPDFDDATWPSGPARLGYGEDGEFTLLNYGPDPTRKPVTTWFRHAFELSGIPTITNLVCRLQRDDGVAVHLNGTELLRHNLRAGTLTPTVLAIADVNNEAEQLWFELPVGTASLREGRNVLAVELHQSNPASSDLGFDLELAAYRDALPASAPRLTAAALPDGTIRIAWPASSGTAGWQLETTSIADPAGSWVPLDLTVVVVEDRMEVVLPAPSGPGAGFYRLARPTAP